MCTISTESISIIISGGRDHNDQYQGNGWLIVQDTSTTNIALQWCGHDVANTSTTTTTATDMRRHCH
jgi:hypothetical protein